MKTLALILLLSACGNPRARSATEANNISSDDLCAKLTQCPEGFGVCIRCDGPNNPQWVWSDTLGTPMSLGIFQYRDRPNCNNFEFDAKGNPVLFKTRSEIQKYEYDEQGRLVAVREDGPEMCEDYVGGPEAGASYWSECGPPDGKWDGVREVSWQQTDDGWTASQGSLERKFDLLGRIVVEHNGSIEKQYTYQDQHRDPQREVVSDDSGLDYQRDYNYGGEAGSISLSSPYFLFPGMQRRVAKATTEQRSGDVVVHELDYDENGNLMSVRADGKAHLVWNHDYQGKRLVKTTQTDTIEGRTSSASFSYDANGFRIAAQYTRQDGSIANTIKTKRDSQGRVIEHWGADYSCLKKLWDPVISASTR